MALKLTNFAMSTLSVAINAAATTLVLATGEGAKFPTLGGGDWFPAILEEGANVEIVHVTARSSDTLTVTRAREGTTALSFGIGARVDLRLTEATLQAILTLTTVAAYLGTAATAALDTDGALAANSDTRVATQKATKTYVDQIIAAQDAMVFKGVIDCSANPNYPAADRGWTYRVSVAGKIGGASGINVEVGDILLCLTDGTASGNQATVGAQWSIIQMNLDGAVIGPSSVTDGNPVLFDGATGKLIKQSTFAAFKTSLALTKSDVGLGNVTNAAQQVVSGQTLAAFGPYDNEPPSSNYAVLDWRNNHPVLAFNDTTQQTAIFTGVLPASYAGGGITVEVYSMAATATSGTHGWDVAIERMDSGTTDMDADSFGSAATVSTSTVPGTSGVILKQTVNISNGANMDSLAAGENFRLRLRRDVVNDNAVGDAQVVSVVVKEQ